MTDWLLERLNHSYRLIWIVVICLCFSYEAYSTRPDNGHRACGPPGPSRPELVRIAKNVFTIGSPITDPTSPKYRKFETPQRPRLMNDFFLGRYLVTAEEYSLFLNEAGNRGYFDERVYLYDGRTIRNDNGIYRPQAYADRCPAYPITWVGADAYCAWLTNKLGCPFRLPTEDEWEAAARGPEGRLWPWGNEPPIVQVSRAYSDPEREGPFPSYEIIFDAKSKAQPSYRTRGYRWNASHSAFDPNRTWIEAPVGSFPMGATPEGIFDMLGFGGGQWCSDVHVKDRLSLTPVSAEGHGNGVERTIRGFHEVPIDRDSYRPRFSIWSIMPDDGARPATTVGRVWSRVGRDPNVGAMFRVAMDASGN